MRICQLFCTLLLLLSMISLHAEKLLNTGEKITALPSLAFLDDKPRRLESFFGKKYIVLYLWDMSPAALREFSAAANVAAASRDFAEFIGIGIGSHNDLKKFPGALNLGFPVNSDSGSAKKLFRRPGDPFPMAAILDKNGVLLWRGPLKSVQKILRECISGEFDLSEQIRVEKFTDTVNNTILNKEFEKAAELIRAEYENHPKKLSLLRKQIQLLKRLDRTDDAFEAIHRAQKKLPAAYRLFEMEYQLIAETEDLDRLSDFFVRLKRNFFDKPEILIAFAMAECQLPPGKLRLDIAIDLAETGWRNQKFSSPAHRGQYALEYAKILHSVGRNDLAQILAESALKDLKDHKQLFPVAEAALMYYTKINAVSAAIKLPDLTKH